MGFFSWHTQDTNKSIANCHSSKETFPVTMTDNKGNRWHENNYEGYGEFGGKDYYELLAEMNGYESDRNKGIQLWYGQSGIQNKETNEIILGDNITFLMWNEPVRDGKTPNELLESGDWISVTVFESGVKFPNLTENPNRKWQSTRPKECKRQGHFY